MGRNVGSDAAWLKEGSYCVEEHGRPLHQMVRTDEAHVSAAPSIALAYASCE